MEFTHTLTTTPRADFPRVTTALWSASPMSISIDSTEAQVTAAIQNENDSYLTSGYYDRTAKKVSHFKVLRDLNNVRLAKGMQFLRVKDEELIQDKLNLISDIHAISDDEFSRSNLCPVLNQVGERDEPLDPDMRELEEFQHLSALLAG